MIKYQRFDEVPAWQEASRLYQHVLDLLEESNLPLSTTFRAQLERTALAVSSQIAQSRDRKNGREAVANLQIARASASEIQSMTAIVSQRPKAARLAEALQQIRTLAESCSRQLSGWIATVENSPHSGKTPPPSSEPENGGSARGTVKH